MYLDDSNEKENKNHGYLAGLLRNHLIEPTLLVSGL
jgi:hypothetical protein